MVMIVTVQVTEAPSYLKQIANVAVHRVQELGGGLAEYAVYLDGVKKGFTTHDPVDGWDVLLRKALDLIALPYSREEDMSDQVRAISGPGRFQPLTADHPGVGETCPACGNQLEEGDVPALVNPRPAEDDEAAQLKAAAGMAYTAEVDIAHERCVYP